MQCWEVQLFVTHISQSVIYMGTCKLDLSKYILSLGIDAYVFSTVKSWQNYSNFVPLLECIIKMFGNDYEMDFNEMNYKCI